MCLSMDESIHSASRSFASRHSFVFSFPVPPSSFVPFTLTVASDVHYLQLSQRKSVPLIILPPFFRLRRMFPVQDQFQFSKWSDL